MTGLLFVPVCCSVDVVVVIVVSFVVVRKTTMQYYTHFHSPVENTEKSTKGFSWTRVRTQIRVCENFTDCHTQFYPKNVHKIVYSFRNQCQAQ